MSGHISLAADQAVIVHSPLPSWSNDQIFDSLEVLEKKLTEAIANKALGEFDGNEIGEGELVLYMYGPDAEKLFHVVEPTLRESSLTKTRKATIRYGGPGARTRAVDLSAR